MGAASFGGDVAGSGVLLMVVTWQVRRRCGALLGGVVVNDVAVSLEAVASTSLPRVGPNAGSHQGARWQQWQPRTMVVGGGGGERKGWDGHNV